MDVERLVALIRPSTRGRGSTRDEVETGAVIITGETARTRNAEEILHGLGELAGDFVVTVAGPNLEAQIAGRGSGAAQWSAANYATVVNVDIGGGSSNAALFRSGRHIASAASMVGGRQAVLDRAPARLTHLAPTGRIIADQLGLDLRVGQVRGSGRPARLTDAMADIVVDLCLGVETPLGAKAALSPPLRVDGPGGGLLRLRRRRAALLRRTPRRRPWPRSRRGATSGRCSRRRSGTTRAGPSSGSSGPPRR